MCVHILCEYVYISYVSMCTYVYSLTLNKGHFWDNINSADLFLVERFSSLGGSKCRYYIGTVSCVLCREVCYSVSLFGRVQYQRCYGRVYVSCVSVYVCYMRVYVSYMSVYVSCMSVYVSYMSVYVSYMSVYVSYMSVYVSYMSVYVSCMSVYLI